MRIRIPKWLMPKAKEMTHIKIIRSEKFDKKEMIAFAQFYKEHKDILEEMVIVLNNDMTNLSQEYSIDFHSGLKEYFNYFKGCYDTIYDDDDTIKREIEESELLNSSKSGITDSY